MSCRIISCRVAGPSPSAVREQLEIVKAVAVRHGGRDAVCVEGEEANKELWMIRKQCLWAAMSRCTYSTFSNISYLILSHLLSFWKINVLWNPFNYFFHDIDIIDIIDIISQLFLAPYHWYDVHCINIISPGNYLRYPEREAMITDACVPLSRLSELITVTRAALDASWLPAPIIAHAGLL